MRNASQKTVLFILSLGFGLGLGSVAQASPVATPELPDLVEKTLPGVVNISSVTITKVMNYQLDQFFRLWGVPQEQKHSALGSGFIVDKEGYVLTNDHVVDQATEVFATTLDKKQYKARIIGKDRKLDLALLQIRDDNRKVPGELTPVPLGDSDKVRIAESVFAVGNPFSLQHTVTLGIISAKDRTVGQGPLNNFLQTDASINPGNSGGPLFNLKGEVIGINTMIYSQSGQSGGLGFAIPINQVKAVLGDLKKYGRVPRPWLGIQAGLMNRQLEEYYGASVSKGVRVHNLVEEAPADMGGFRKGDIITELDGTPTPDPGEIERVLARHKPTDQVSAKVQRGQKSIELKIQLEELPAKLLDKLPRGII